jgi:hypothetical protein
MNHYVDCSVRDRIWEFLGAESSGSSPTALFITSADEESQNPGEPLPIRELGCKLQENREIFRSLWDRESLLVDLDIEYVNFDLPAEPYVDFDRAFALQAPLILEVEKALLHHGIAPLHLLSGRGHHFIWRVRRDSRCFARLAHLGRLPLSHKGHYNCQHSPSGETVDYLLASAFAGLGQVIEYFADEMKKQCAPRLKLPIELSAIEVGPGERGRELISFDISQYGDPLDTRTTRVAYSRYLKLAQQNEVAGGQNNSCLPPIFTIPLYEMSLSDALRIMHDPESVSALAAYAPAKIPDCSAGMDNLLTSYLSSELALFHCHFYSEEPDPPADWPHTYERIDLDQLPVCIQFLLQNPNDLLLRPSSIRRVVIALLSLGWHPRHISGLIRSKFEHDYGWGIYWDRYDPAARAEFFTRLFSGLIVARYDNVVDFNCCSTQEEKICFSSNCQDNLERFRTSLLNRRTCGRLARRPFHRLFLPAQHP